MSMDIFSEIEAAAKEDEQLQTVDLGPVSRMVEDQWGLERPENPQNVDQLYELTKELGASISDIEELLSRRKKDLFKVRQVQIPEYMKMVNLGSLTTSSGVSITIEKGVSTTIKDDEKFFKFLKDEKSADIIKDVVTVTVEKPEDIEEVIKTLDQTDCFYERKRSVHSQTLKKFVKDRMEAGKPLPAEEVLSVFEYSYSKISTKKKKGK